MDKDKKKILAGAGILGGAALAYMLARKKGAPPPPPGMAALYGKVTDAETGKAIESIEVTVNGYGGSTNSYGNYQIQAIPPGKYAVTFRDPLGGYETLIM